MIKKEEILLHAIGELPEDMITEEDIEEIKAGARQLEKEERKKKLIYIIQCMAVAACIAILVISANAFHKPGNNRPGSSIKPGRIHSGTDSNTSQGNAGNNTEYGKNSEEKSDSDRKKTASVFIMDFKEKTVENSVSSSTKKTTGTKIPYGKTVNLQLVKQKYVVFSIDTNFHITVSNKKSKTYIIKGSRKKYYIKDGETSCKAGNQVYFDVNGTTALDVVIPKWKEQGISVIAYAEAGQAGGGTFYIGKADGGGAKNNKKGEKYYGIFIKES